MQTNGFVAKRSAAWLASLAFIAACGGETSGGAGGGGGAAGGNVGGTPGELDSGPTGGTPVGGTGGSGGSGGAPVGGGTGGAGGSGGTPVGGAGGSGGTPVGGSGGTPVGGAGGSGGTPVGGAGGAGGAGGSGGTPVGGFGGAGGGGPVGGFGGAGGSGGTPVGGFGGAGGGGPVGGFGGAGGGGPVGGFAPNCALVGDDLAPGGACCEGLTATCGDGPSPEGACPVQCDRLTCVACGDGLCGAAEDPCNCPADCGNAGVCIPGGQPIDINDPASPGCCDGFFALSCDAPMMDGQCRFGCQEIFYCAECGNGACDDNENFCNCPNDCDAPEVECSETGEALSPLGSCCNLRDTPVLASQPNANNECQFGMGGLVCARTNNGDCGVGENFCNSPVDCPAPPPPCTQEGFQLEVFRPGAACCAGLEQVGCSQPDGDGVCREQCVGTTFCTDCGDGTCDAPENACNCPADCAVVPGCVAEGMSVPVIPNAPSCCPGTGLIGCDRPNAQGQCGPCVGASICAQCGDGECGPGENACNCADDCGAN